MAIVARYTSQIVALVEEDVRERLDRVAEEEDLSVGQVIREALELGLPLREAGVGE